MGSRADGVEVVDVVVVGAGPCGISTALHLLEIDPRWASRLLVLEKAAHPREKLCGGGISPLGERVLRGLRLQIPEPHFRADRIELVFPGGTHSLAGQAALHIVHRAAFDAWLVRQAISRGVRVCQEEPALDLAVQADGLMVTTSRRVLRAKLVVAADGSKSRVRRALGWTDHSHLARLLEVLTPERPEESRELRERTAVFDFRPAPGALQGYYWDFPSVVNGQAHMNRGVFDSRICQTLPLVALKPLLRAQLADRGRGLDEAALQGHPLRWYHPGASYARPRVLLAGDAAGSDPLFGEGIPFALGFGKVAARAVADAFARNDFSLDGYRALVKGDPLLRQLRVRYHVARLLYGERSRLSRALLERLVPALVKRLYRRALRQERSAASSAQRT